MRKSLLYLFLLSFPMSLLCQVTYYSKSAGNLNTLSTWGTNPDGSGTSPTNFTTANRTYIIVNNTAPTISANWTVSGANSKVLVGDGTQTINFTVPSPRTVVATYSVMVNGTLTAASGSTISGSTVHVNGTFDNFSTNNPTFGTLAVGSTVKYSRSGNQTVLNASYSALQLNGSGTKSLSNISNTTVGGTLTISTGVVFALNTSNLLTCTLNGTVSGAGTITGGTSSNLTIGGTGALGTLSFTGGSQSLYNFIINRTGSGSLSLGGSLTISGNFTLTNGIISINAYTLTLSGAVTFPASPANGSFTGSSSSNLSLLGTSFTNSLFFTSGAQTLNNLTVNCGTQTVTIGSDLTVNGTFFHARGVISLNGLTVTLNGVVNFSNSIGNGSFRGSASSSLLLNGTSYSNRLFMSAGAETLNNFSLNSSGQTVRMGTPLTVVGAYTQTNGILWLSNQSLTLSGTIVFPVSSANGTITGSNTSDLSISASSIANPLFFTVGAQALRNFTFNSPGQTLTMGTNLVLSGAFTHTAGILNLNGTTLTMNGAITFPASVANGSFSGSTTSSLSIGGTGLINNSLLLTQSGTANYLNNFTLNRVGGTVTLANALNIIGALTPTAGTFSSGGNLILRATSSTVVGRIGTIGTSGSVTGNVTAQMYAKGGTTGWTHMGSPGLTGRTFADWDDNTTITCANCPDGFFNFTSVYWYDETVGGLYDNALRYIPIANISDAMTIGKGFWLYLGTSTSTTADILMDATGPVNQQNFNFSLTRTSTGGGTDAADHGYNLICNPYPSPIQWSLLRNANPNVANAVHVYNPDLSGYATYVNGISSPAVGSGGIGNFIPGGQAFYVKVDAPTATLTAQETNKGASTQELLKTNGQQTQSASNPVLMRLKVNGHAMQNETVVYFDVNATGNYDIEYDAWYMGPDLGYLGMGTRFNGSDYTINGLPPLNQNYSIPVFVTTDTTDTYSISGTDLQNMPGGACIILHDNYTGLDKDLRTGSYSCTINDTEKIAARFVLNITINNNLSIAATSIDPTCYNSANGLLIATPSGAGPWNYYWKDVNNNIIKTTLNKSSADSLLNANTGNYSVDVNTVGTCDNGTVSFTLISSNAPLASFSPSATSVVFISDSVSVAFSNTSSNAASYWWDFGDGMGGIGGASHAFTAPGDYTVTLAAIGPCGDTSYSSQVITVIDGSSIGIAAIAEPTKKMFISRDASGYYVQFNYKETCDAHISVQSILGAKATSDINLPHISNDKVYIPIGNSENKILVISVITGAGEKTWCKIVTY